MSVEAPKLNGFGSVRSASYGLPDKDRLVDRIREYDYVLQHRLGGVEVIDAADYAALPKDVLELRAFSGTGELHLVNAGGRLLGRVRTDETGQDSAATEVFDEEHLVWGTRATQCDGAVVLREDRGTVLRLPASVASEFPDILKMTASEKAGGSAPRYFVTVRVRNYLGEEKTDPESGDTSFAFVDYRLMGFNVREVK